MILVVATLVFNYTRKPSGKAAGSHNIAVPTPPCTGPATLSRQSSRVTSCAVHYSNPIVRWLSKVPPSPARNSRGTLDVPSQLQLLLPGLQAGAESRKISKLHIRLKWGNLSSLTVNNGLPPDTGDGAPSRFNSHLVSSGLSLTLLLSIQNCTASKHWVRRTPAA